MTRIMFFTRPSQDRLDLSACPSSEVDPGKNVSVSRMTTAYACKDFSSPVRLVTMSARRAGDARPGGPLFPDKNPSDFLSDLPDARTKMLTRPTADTPRRLEVADGFTGFNHERFARASRQRDGLSCLAIQQLLDCGARRFLQMPLSSPFRLPSRRLLQEGTQGLALIPIAPRHADVHPDITGDDIRRQDRLDLGELDKDPCNQPAFLPLPDFAGRPELPPTTQSILQSFMSLCRHGFARRWCNPVGVTCTPGFFDRRVTEQREVSRALKWVSRGFLRCKPRVDDAACPLLRLIGDPAQARRTLRVTLGVRSLGVILRAVIQRVPAIPILAVPGLLRFAGVGFDLQRIGANDARRFHSLGVFQSGEWHLAQTRTLGFRGIHGRLKNSQSWPSFQIASSTHGINLQRDIVIAVVIIDSNSSTINASNRTIEFCYLSFDNSSIDQVGSLGTSSQLCLLISQITKAASTKFLLDRGHVVAVLFTTTNAIHLSTLLYPALFFLPLFLFSVRSHAGEWHLGLGHTAGLGVLGIHVLPHLLHIKIGIFIV